MGFACLSPLALVALWTRAPLGGLAIMAMSHALLLYSILRPNVQWLGPVMTRFAATGHEVWLTIDDGPGDDTEAILDLFDAHGVKATFFVKGVLAERHPLATGEIVRRGHTVANHSHTHPSATFWCAFPARVATEIDECNRVLATVTGATPRWFRAPVGHKNPAVHPALARRGMRLIGWSARGFDAVLSDPEEVVRRIVSDVRPGAILLLHQGRSHSLPVLKTLIATVHRRGYSFVIPRDEQLCAV